VKEYYINRQIKAPTIRLVLENGKIYGEVSLTEGLEKAQDEGLDLVQVSNRENIPICKLIDYGKLKYKNSKKKSNKKEKIKEIRINFNIGEHDLEVKNRKVIKFLLEHKKVKYVLKLRGRQIDMIEEAKQKIKNVLELFRNRAKWDGIKISRSDSSCLMTIILNPV